ncbi:MAG: hypothetical protein J2P58_02980 [Acidimicrobiaceae bacterium]|nr:hypothetical protein [Acidimicrobiaceae bacterium]
MPGRIIEWRRAEDGEEAVIAVEESTDVITRVWPASPAILADFLNDMHLLESPSGGVDEGFGSDPEDWGDVVIARSESGQILRVDPQLYWEGVATWFRSRGDDPHRWRDHH